MIRLVITPEKKGAHRMSAIVSDLRLDLAEIGVM